MTVHEISPDVDRAQWLDGADFADAFQVDISGRPIDAREAAIRMFNRPPRWADALLTLRHLIVAPFGLKSSGASDARDGGMIGIFPVVSETPDRLVAGFNDHHLDFRAVIDVVARGDGQQVTATTLVRTHNWPGRTYLALIIPFHRLIVKAMLRQVAAG
jgi:hypothetical protein